MRKRRSTARKARQERDRFSSRKRRRGRALKRAMLLDDSDDPLSAFEDGPDLDELYGPLRFFG